VIGRLALAALAKAATWWLLIVGVSLIVSGLSR